MHCTCTSLLSGVFTPALTRSTPSFLLPALCRILTAPFSTSSRDRARKDGNPSRGVSALRRTGLGKRQTLSVKMESLPQPVLDPARRSKVDVDPEHGLWEFFPKEKGPMGTPGEMDAHGRAWTVAELRVKNWEDLHRLWWVCLKEMNRLKTWEMERIRVGNLHGAYESEKRVEEVRKTMKGIKHTLTERWYAWQNAREAAMDDPEINMYADTDNGEAAYNPMPDYYHENTQESSDSGSAVSLDKDQKLHSEARA